MLTLDFPKYAKDVNQAGGKSTVELSRKLEHVPIQVLAALDR